MKNIVLIACCLCCQVASAQETFRLVVPGEPSTNSTAVLQGNRITISTGGTSFSYTRNPVFDSLDGKYAAYYSLKAKQYVRFPKSGTGKMFIGSTSGLSLTWRESRMVVEKSGSPGAGAGTGTATGISSSAQTSNSLSDLAQLEMKNGNRLVGYVNGAGRLNLFRGKEDQWQPVKLTQTKPLVANSPIAFLPSPKNQIPDVLIVDSQKRLSRITNGTTLVPISKTGDPRFKRRSRITVAGDQQSCFVADETGQIWEYDFVASSFRNIESRQGLVLPGTDMEVVDNQLFVVDKFGNLAGYTKNASTWSKPFLVDKGFKSGGMISSWRQSGLVSSKKAIVSVNDQGKPYVAFWQNKSWVGESIDPLALAPGAPIGISNRSGNFFVSFVDPKGRWTNYRRTGNGLVHQWVPHNVANGFATGGSVVVDSFGLNAFSLDRSGRLVAAHYRNGSWDCFLCNPALRWAPRLRQREVVPNPPIPPVEIVLQNKHKEALVVRVFDKRDRSKKYDLKLEPFASAKIKIDRDPGAVAREAITIVGPRGGGVQDTRVVNLPPEVLYDVVVFENKVTSQFFDRTKNKSNRPDSQQKSLVSVGVFPIPPGGQMKTGSTVSVFDSAKEQRNPGAAALFGPIKQ